MGNIGPLEIGIVLVIILIVFGPKRLPGLGKQLGTGMREFKESITGEDKDKDERSTLTQAQADPAAATNAAPKPAEAEAEAAQRTSTGA
jgi:sec-independent protein translocase protein TatA